MINELVEQHVSTLNAFIPNIDALYSILQEGTFAFYLPKRNSRCVTQEYLLQLSNRTLFALENNLIVKYDNYRMLRIEKLQLFKELEKYITSNKKKPLGFTFKNMPNKRWLTDVLFTLDPDNRLFKLLDKDIYRKISKE